MQGQVTVTPKPNLTVHFAKAIGQASLTQKPLGECFVADKQSGIVEIFGKLNGEMNRGD